MVGAEIDVPRVHGGHREPAADGDEQRPREHEQDERDEQGPPAGRQRPHAPPQQHGMKEAVEQRGIADDRHKAEGDEPTADTGHGILRRGEEVENGRGVETEAPIVVERQVNDKDEREQQADEHIIAAVYPMQDARARPGGDNGQQPRHHREIGGHRRVQHQPVPDDAPPVGAGHVRVERAVAEHEQRFLQREDAEEQQIGFDQFDDTMFHNPILGGLDGLTGRPHAGRVTAAASARGPRSNFYSTYSNRPLRYSPSGWYILMGWSAPCDSICTMRTRRPDAAAAEKTA